MLSLLLGVLLRVLLRLLLGMGVAAFVPLAGAADAADAPYRWQLPPGFPQPLVPVDNPMSTAKVALGRRLFFESRPSVTGRYSCASCHEPQRAFSDGRALALGATGAALHRNAMSLVNVAYNSSYGWDRPSVRLLETQMLTPLFNQHPVEIGLSGRQRSLLALLRQDRDYATAFASAFPAVNSTDSVSTRNMIRAIAAFERTLIVGNSPFDRYVYGGDHDAINADAKRGLALFYSARLGCASCHGGFNFTGTWNEAGAAPATPAFACDGVGARSHRVPTLRNLGLTAPYMHDGRYATLVQVLSHYEHATVQSACADKRLRRFELTEAERSQLLAFLRSLDSPATEFASYADGH